MVRTLKGQHPGRKSGVVWVTLQLSSLHRTWPVQKPLGAEAGPTLANKHFTRVFVSRLRPCEARAKQRAALECQSLERGEADQQDGLIPPLHRQARLPVCEGPGRPPPPRRAGRPSLWGQQETSEGADSASSGARDHREMTLSRVDISQLTSIRSHRRVPEEDRAGGSRAEAEVDDGTGTSSCLSSHACLQPHEMRAHEHGVIVATFICARSVLS